MNRKNRNERRTSNITMENVVEGLESVNPFAELLQVDVGEIKPCYARIFYDGVSGQRNNYAYALASYFRIKGKKNHEETEELIRDWNNRTLADYLEFREIKKIVRNAFKPKYKEEPNCKHLLIEPYCIGEDCHVHKYNKNANKFKEIGYKAFIYNDWLKSKRLTPAAKICYLGLDNIRTVRSASPKQMFRCTFAELERETAISRSALKRNLESLLKLGLLDHLEITPQGIRAATAFRLTYPMPYAS